MSVSPHAVHPEDPPPFEFWSYFDGISDDDRDGHDFSLGTVSRAWDMPGGRWQHVLINSEDENVFMVLVLDKSMSHVHGHYLLDLNLTYGTDEER